MQHMYQPLHTHRHLMALCPGLPWWANTRKLKPIWILLKQETVSGSGITWAICSRQITIPAPQHSVFYRPDALPAAQPTASKHWRQLAQCTASLKCMQAASVLPQDVSVSVYIQRTKRWQTDKYETNACTLFTRYSQHNSNLLLINSIIVIVIHNSNHNSNTLLVACRQFPSDR